MNKAGKLLKTGTGYPDYTNLSSANAIGKSDADSGNDGSAAIRSHDQESLLVGILL